MLKVNGYVYLYDKRDFENITKLWILIHKNYPGLSKWNKYNHKGLYKDERGREIVIREEMSD
jgi:hypothetical protein